VLVVEGKRFVNWWNEIIIEWEIQIAREVKRKHRKVNNLNKRNGINSNKEWLKIETNK